MFQFGLGTPPRMAEAGTLANDFTGTPVALPARPGNRAWKYAMVTNNASGAQAFAFGHGATGASAPDAEDHPWFSVCRADGAVIVNVTGCDRFSVFGSGQSMYMITPIDDIGGRERGMLNSPPQVGQSTSVVVDASSAQHTAIPNNSSGNKPKYVMLSYNTAAALRVGLSLGSGTPYHLYLSRDAMPVVLNCAGYSHIYNESGSAGSEVILAPLEF